MVDYSDEDKEEMRKSYAAILQSKKSRLEELIAFLKLSNFRKIGIANCLSMQKYADRLEEILTEQGFEVCSINCKESKLEGCKISDEIKGFSCDPLFQAYFLNQKQTDFNINVGLCLGHGLLFQKYSQVPVTTFMVKDFAHQHHIEESLL